MYQLSLKPMLRAFGRGLQDAKVKFTRFDLSSSFLCCVSLCRHADALPRSYTAFGLEHDSIVFSHIFPPSFTKSSRHSQKLVFPTSSRETQVAFILTRSTSAPTTESKPEKRRRHPPPPPLPSPFQVQSEGLSGLPSLRPSQQLPLLEASEDELAALRIPGLGSPRLWLKDA